MANKKGLNIVTFQFPIPANYGGVIEVYERIKALKESGYFIILHSFIYDREYDKSIEDIADEVYCYKREKKIITLFSHVPFIVRSRYSNELVTNLILNDYPILFEGLHTCASLNDTKLRTRIRWVRAHNIEHDYYNYLAHDKKTLLKSLYYKAESVKLKLFENILSESNAILAITDNDKLYFEKKYANSNTKVVHLPCFAAEPKREANINLQNQILYHGNLSVEENQQAVIFILEQLANSIDYPFIIAGANPPNYLRKKILASKNKVQLIENPSDEHLKQLIQSSIINLLITFQPTGIKLKLINALRLGNHVIVNDEMVRGTSLEEFCIVSETEELLRTLSNQLTCLPLTSSELHERDCNLKQLLSNQKSVSIIDDLYNMQYANFSKMISE